jgi:DNA-binding Lrp family transcriptional regulator
MVSTNGLNSCTDEQFIALWDKHQSVTKIAKILGITERAVNYRRRSMEENHKVKLGGVDPRSAKYDSSRPKSFSPLKQVNLGIEDGCILVFSDAHFIPGQRSTAFRGLLWAIQEFKPKAVICNGDAFDGASISRHDITDQPQTSVIQELKACQGALGEIEEVAKAARHNVKLLFTWGNHDIRFGNRLAQHAPQFKDVLGFKLTDHIPDWDFCWAVWPTDKVIIKHRYKGGIHATHNATLNAGVSCITGHLHSLKVTPFTDYNGTRYGVDTGTLAEPDGPQFTYAEINPSNHRSGFAVLNFFNGQLLWPELAHKFGEGLIEFRGSVVDVSEL